MKQPPKCPYWDEKEGKCTLETQLAETPLGREILPDRLQALENLASNVSHPPSDESPAYFGEDEGWKEKLEYWEKELEKMDKEKEK